MIDSGSTDRTVESPRRQAPGSCTAPTCCPSSSRCPGKGEVLWRSLAATSGDLLVFLDSDLVDFDAGFVPALLGPLLTEPGVALVKGFYRRPLRLETPSEADSGGGRVTELIARPLLAALRPQLSGVVQPLGGEYAGTGSCWSPCRSRPGTASRSGCCSTPRAAAGSTRSRRSTSACASTATARCCSSA